MIFLISLIGVAILSCAKLDANKESTTELTEIFTKDSTLLVALYQNALTSQESSQPFLEAIDSLTTKNSGYFDFLDLEFNQRSVYELKRGEFAQSLRTTQLGLLINSPFRHLQKARYYNLRGHIFSFQKDNSSAINSFKQALAIYESLSDSINQAYVSNNIANVFFSLNDFETAYKYVSVSYDILNDNKDDPYYSSILSILAISESAINKPTDAKRHAEEALALSENTGNIVPWILSLYALGDVAHNENEYHSAIDFHKQSLSLSEKYNLKAYMLINQVALLNLYVLTKQYIPGIEHGLAAQQLSIEVKNETVLLSLYKNLANAYEGIKQGRTALEYMNQAYQLKEEISAKENTEIIHDLLIQYESEKKDREIYQNKIKILENEATINRNQFYLVLSGIGIFVLLLIIFEVIKNRRQVLRRMKSEKEAGILKANIKGEQKERMRFSRELHDGIASELIGLKIKAQENQMDPEWIEKLNEVHQEVRRISHNLSPYKIEQHGLVEALKLFCIENQSKKTNIHFFSNVQQEISKDKAQVIYRVAQEIIQNALKYAAASEIDVQIFASENKIRLSIEDNGKGMNNVAMENVTTKIISQWQSTPFILDIHGESQENAGTSIIIEFLL